jgi:hypothetical protein
LLVAGGRGEGYETADARGRVFEEQGLLTYLAPDPLIAAPGGFTKLPAMEAWVRDLQEGEPSSPAIGFDPVEEPARYLQEVERGLYGGGTVYQGA